jgi:hypothetical protein
MATSSWSAADRPARPAGDAVMGGSGGVASSFGGQRLRVQLRLAGTSMSDRRKHATFLHTYTHFLMIILQET